MKKLSIVFLAVLALSFVLTSCSKDKDNDNKQCTAKTAQETATVNVNVTYFASKTGEGNVTSLTYQGPTGAVTVNDPKLPYQVTVTIPAGKAIGISVTGVMTNGKIEVSHAVRDAADNDLIHQTGSECSR